MHTVPRHTALAPPNWFKISENDPGPPRPASNAPPRPRPRHRAAAIISSELNLTTNSKQIISNYFRYYQPRWLRRVTAAKNRNVTNIFVGQQIFLAFNQHQWSQRDCPDKILKIQSVTVTKDCTARVSRVTPRPDIHDMTEPDCLIITSLCHDDTALSCIYCQQYYTTCTLKTMKTLYFDLYPPPPPLPPFCPDSDSGAKYCTEQILFSVGRSRRSDNDFGSHLKMDWKLSDDPWDSVFSCNSHEQTRHTECSPLTSQPVCLWWWLQTAPTWPAWLHLKAQNTLQWGEQIDIYNTY